MVFQLVEKKGMGLIGVFLILCVISFFFTMFYIVIDYYFTNFYLNFAVDAGTTVYFNEVLLPAWRAIPVIFMLSIIIWALIQSQNPFNIIAIGGVWMTILFSWAVFSLTYVAFDNMMMTQLPSLFPAGETVYSSFYTNFVIVLWRTVPYGVIIILLIFALYMASTYFEPGGRTYNYGGY